eukprot:c20126_g1_i1.p1 GENE.c20126_g1_i1~~c20126_g1_i1.p1  ORF type:complete len:798 (+),score=212.37 c20126_g1_i1:53-2395(+)
MKLIILFLLLICVLSVLGSPSFQKDIYENSVDEEQENDFEADGEDLDKSRTTEKIKKILGLMSSEDDTNNDRLEKKLKELKDISEQELKYLAQTIKEKYAGSKDRMTHLLDIIKQKKFNLRHKSLLKSILSKTGEVDVKPICDAFQECKSPEMFKRMIGLIESMSQSTKKKDTKIKLIEIKNRVCLEHIKARIKVDRFSPFCKDLQDISQLFEGIKGDISDKEITKVKQELPEEYANVVSSYIVPNKYLEISDKERLIEEGAYKLYSEGYTKISLKLEGATPGFICKDPVTKSMCIIKTGLKGRDEAESIAEHFACHLGKDLLKEAENKGAPVGISEGIPDVSLINLSQKGQKFTIAKGYVKSIFLDNFKELFKDMGEKERPRLFTADKTNKYCKKLKSERPQLFNELSWYLAFRHIVRDLDGHSANFGLMKRKDGTTHMSLIDAGLAGIGIASHPVIKYDFIDKRLITHKINGETSPNHLSDWTKVYEDEEFQKACQTLKDIFEKNSDIIKKSMLSSLEFAEKEFGLESVKKYCVKWIGIEINENDFDITKAVEDIFQIHKERAIQLDKIINDGNNKNIMAYYNHIPVDDILLYLDNYNNLISNGLEAFMIEHPEGLTMSVLEHKLKHLAGKSITVTEFANIAYKGFELKAKLNVEKIYDYQKEIVKHLPKSVSTIEVLDYLDQGKTGEISAISLMNKKISDVAHKAIETIVNKYGSLRIGGAKIDEHESHIVDINKIRQLMPQKNKDMARRLIFEVKVDVAIKKMNQAAKRFKFHRQG